MLVQRGIAWEGARARRCSGAVVVPVAVPVVIPDDLQLYQRCFEWCALISAVCLLMCTYVYQGCSYMFFTVVHFDQGVSLRTCTYSVASSPARTRTRILLPSTRRHGCALGDRWEVKDRDPCCWSQI